MMKKGEKALSYVVRQRKRSNMLREFSRQDGSTQCATKPPLTRSITLMDGIALITKYENLGSYMIIYGMYQSKTAINLL